MKNLIYCCFFIGLFVSLPVHAEEYKVTIYGTMHLVSTPVFGETETFNVTLKMTINTNSGFDVFMPGTAPGPNLYGYESGAISMPGFNVGSKTFVKGDLINVEPAAGFSAAIWFDMPLSHGASPNIWVSFNNNNDIFQFGNFVCDAYCSIDNSAATYDFDPGNMASSRDSNTVQVTKTDSPQAIPTLSEWGMIIFSLMLAGSAIWMIRRRQIS